MRGTSSPFDRRMETRAITSSADAGKAKLGQLAQNLLDRDFSPRGAGAQDFCDASRDVTICYQSRCVRPGRGISPVLGIDRHLGPPAHDLADVGEAEHRELEQNLLDRDFGPLGASSEDFCDAEKTVQSPSGTPACLHSPAPPGLRLASADSLCSDGEGIN